MSGFAGYRLSRGIAEIIFNLHQKKKCPGHRDRGINLRRGGKQQQERREVVYVKNCTYKCVCCQIKESIL
jgi:hypothetical protein